MHFSLLFNLLETEVTHKVSNVIDHPRPHYVLLHLAVLAPVTQHHLHPGVGPGLGLRDGRVDGPGQEVAWLSLLGAGVRIIQLG